MKVLYLHQYFVPPQAAGGTRSYEFARRLLAGGHQVVMITSSAHIKPEYTRRSGRRLISRFTIAGIPCVIIHVPYSQKLDYGQRIVAFLKFSVLSSLAAMKHRADVVFATSTPLTIAIPGIVAKLWHRAPLVFEVRDLWPEMPVAVGALRNPLLRMLAEALEWVAYHASSHIVALSPGMAEGIAQRGIPEERVTVIPNSCDVELFDVPSTEGLVVRNALGLAEGQPLIIYTGSFGLVNGVDYLVRIAASMLSLDPDVRFLLVGEGAEAQKVRGLAAELGVLDVNLWIWKPVPKQETPRVLSAATVATSLFVPLEAMWKNSANKFFDALAAGKPVAINYGGWQADLIEQSGAGVVLPPDDAEQAARILLSFVRDPGKLQMAAESARALAYTYFHRDLMATKLEGVLREAL